MCLIKFQFLFIYTAVYQYDIPKNDTKIHELQSVHVYELRKYVTQEPLLTESLQRNHMNRFQIKSRGYVTPRNS